MSRRYELAMQKHGRQKKIKPQVKALNLKMMTLMNDPQESEYEATWRRSLFSPRETDEDKSKAVVVDEDLPLTLHAVGIGEQNPNQIGQEFSGITDRISKLLTDYESMYDEKDQQGYAAMQQQLSGQIAMEDLLTGYKSLCREREEVLHSLHDSLDVDEEEMLNELEALSRKDQSIDMEGAQQAIHDTFQHVRDTTNKLKMMNKKMIDLSKAGEATEELEQEKRQLERELHMYKKMAVQQRKDILHRRSSVRKDDIQQWKLVAGEMVDILNTVRNAGKLDKESLEKELGKIILTLNSQTEFIDNLKRELSKQEKGMKNLEKDKNRLNSDKVLVEGELRTKQIELKQCKQYLRKVLKEKKDGEKIKIDEAEIDLADEIKLHFSGLSTDTTNIDILQAQVRDARKVVSKLEEENRELQRKLASLPAAIAKEAPAGEESTSPVTQEARDIKSAHAKDCPKCSSYKARLANCSEELKEKRKHIERLKEDLNKLRALPSTSKKDSTDDESEQDDKSEQDDQSEQDDKSEQDDQSEQALAEAELKRERFQSGTQSSRQSGKTSSTKGAVEAEVTTSQASSDHEAESEEEPIKEKPKKTSTLTVPGKKTKQKALKSPVRRKKIRKAKQERKEDEKGDDEDEEEEVVEEQDKKEPGSLTKKEKKGSRMKRRELLVGECREERAPYVKVREARMVTLADKGTQTSQYDRKVLEGINQRPSVVRHSQHRRRSLAETIMAGVAPSAVEEETKAAAMLIEDEADRLCDEISGFVEYGFDLVQQGAKTTRVLIDTHLGEKGTELLESSDNGTFSIDKALKPLMSSDHRRQNLMFASKKRRPSLQLERRGTIGRDSKGPLIDTPTDGMLGRKREDSVGAETDRAHLERDSLAEQKGDTLTSAGTEAQTEQPSDSVTGQRDTAVTTEQGPPVARRNTLFPDENTINSTQTQQEDDDNRSSEELQQPKEIGDDRSLKKQQPITIDAAKAQGKTDDNRSSMEVGVTGHDFLTQDKEAAPLSVPKDASHVFDAALVKESKWSTLENLVSSLHPHAGAGCSHVLNEVKHIAQKSGAIPPEDQIKEQVTVMAQLAIDTIQSAAQVLRHQLEDELNMYEKFYKLWETYREDKRPTGVVNRSDDVPVLGIKILSTLDERGDDAIKTEESTIFPPIIPQESSFPQTFGRGKAIAMAGLSRDGMMMIQGAGPHVPISTSQSKMKKRGKIKNWSRKQLLMKQKAVMDKVLHVDARIEDLRNILSEVDENQSHYIRQSQGIPPVMSQDFYFPLTAHSVALPSVQTGLQIQGAVDRYSVKQEKEKKAPIELSKEAKHSESTQLPGLSTVWQRRQSIARVPSQRNVWKSSHMEQEAKLPLLNINRFLQVGP